MLSAEDGEDFWLRKHYFQSHFELVDQFVSPSEFLRQRYIAWGLQPEQIVVIENGQSASRRWRRAAGRGRNAQPLRILRPD
jgi:hypothetical protein